MRLRQARRSSRGTGVRAKEGRPAWRGGASPSWKRPARRAGRARLKPCATTRSVAWPPCSGSHVFSGAGRLDAPKGELILARTLSLTMPAAVLATTKGGCVTVDGPGNQSPAPQQRRPHTPPVDTSRSGIRHPCQGETIETARRSLSGVRHLRRNAAPLGAQSPQRQHLRCRIGLAPCGRSR